MTTPLDTLRDKVIVPVHNFYKNYIGSEARHAYFKKIANFIFKYSNETALIMLAFNSFSILTAHRAHINSLKKSNRENKEYLISQEKAETIGDLVFTIIPPFIIESKLKHKLESGQWDTKEFRDKYVNIAGPLAGASRDELYSTEHLRPVSETIFSLIDKLTEKYSAEEMTLPFNLQNPLKKINAFAKKKLPDVVTKMPTVTTEDITTDILDKAANGDIPKEMMETFRNKNPFDEFCRRNHGILLLATIGCTIISSSIIMPILKNKYANYTYKKELAKIGETKESIKRKQRFAYTKIESPFDDNNIFSNNSLTSTSSIQDNTKKLKETPFKNIDDYYNTPYKSSGLRI